MEWQFGVKQSYFETNPDRWVACGVCCIYYVFKKMGFELTPREFVSITESKIEINLMKPNGLSLDELCKIFSSFNVTQALKLINRKNKENLYDCLSRFATPNLPVIVFPSHHTIAVLEVVGRTVYYMESDETRQIVSCKSFSSFCDYVFNKSGFVVVMILVDS